METWRIGGQVRKMRSQVSWMSPKSWKARFEKKNMNFSKVVSTHLWNTTLNLYQPSIKGFLSQLARGICLGCALGVCCNVFIIIFTPTWGIFSILANIFQMGWNQPPTGWNLAETFGKGHSDRWFNHQLVNFGGVGDELPSSKLTWLAEISPILKIGNTSSNRPFWFALLVSGRVHPVALPVALGNEGLGWRC